MYIKQYIDQYSVCGNLPPIVPSHISWGFMKQNIDKKKYKTVFFHISSHCICCQNWKQMFLSSLKQKNNNNILMNSQFINIWKIFYNHICYFWGIDSFYTALKGPIFTSNISKDKDFFSWPVTNGSFI